MQANLDHTRAATSQLINYIEAFAVNIAIVGDPCTRSGLLPGLPNSIKQVSQTTDPKVLVLLQSVLFDYFPVLVSQFVVAVKFSSRSFSFLLIAVYAAPFHSDWLNPGLNLSVTLGNRCSARDYCRGF